MMEVIVLRGKAEQIRKLLTQIKSIKGIKHSSLMMTTTGKGLE